MRTRVEMLVGKAVIVAAVLLFAQIVWVGVQGGMSALGPSRQAAQTEEAGR